ncbi:hypothetical protein HDU96_003086, partial [Phlyctochytrium bullatum]
MTVPAPAPSAAPAAAAAAGPAGGGPATPLPELTTANLQAIVSALQTKMKKFYVLGDDIANAVCAVLQTHLDDGTYAAILANPPPVPTPAPPSANGPRRGPPGPPPPTTPLESAYTALAAQLTADLRSANADKHLSVRFTPNPEPEEQDPATKPVPMPNDADEEDDAATSGADPIGDYFKALAQGIVEVRRLKGNVGYIKVIGFPEFRKAKRAVAAAFENVRFTQALIIDVRDGMGGDGYTSDLWVSYLCEGVKDLTQIYWKPQDQTVTTRTQEKVDGPRYLD